MTQKQQDYPILVEVTDANLYEEVALVIAATGRDFQRVEHVDPASAKFRRAPAVIVDCGGGLELGLEGQGSFDSRGPAVLYVCADADPQADGFSLPSQALELAGRLGRSGPVSATAMADSMPEEFDQLADECALESPRPLTARPTASPSAAFATSAERSGTAIMVASAVGGAGASTIAASLSLALAKQQPTCLVDADEFSGGADLLLAMENELGIRWPDIQAEQGHLDGSSLFQALPKHPGTEALGVITGSRYRNSRDWAVTPQVLTTVLDSLVAQDVATIMDTPRHLLCEEGLTQRADYVVLVVPLSLRGVAAAERLHTQLRRQGIDPVVVARAQRSQDIDRQDIECALNTEVRGEVPYLKSLSHEIDAVGLSASVRQIFQAMQPLIDELLVHSNPTTRRVG